MYILFDMTNTEYLHCIILQHSIDDLEQFTTECEELYIHFQHRNLEAIVCSVKGSIDILRKRITTRLIHVHKHVHIMIIIMI